MVRHDILPNYPFEESKETGKSEYKRITESNIVIKFISFSRQVYNSRIFVSLYLYGIESKLFNTNSIVEEKFGAWSLEEVHIALLPWMLSVSVSEELWWV